MKDSTVNINIEIEEKAIAGYEFFVDGKLYCPECYEYDEETGV